MTVVDASVVAAALADAGTTGRWALDQLAAGRLSAPHLLPVEVTSVLRRAEAARSLSAEAAALAYADLDAVPVELAPFAPFASRVWALRNTVAPYDAWYVALAEALGAPLVTLDRRLASAPGPTCRFVTPR
jgi:predicted nucleic acid-binding protein